MDFLRPRLDRRRPPRRGRTLIALVEGLERRGLLSLAPIPASINLIAGAQPASPVTVGSFLDSDTTAPAGQFVASIDWGDGQITTGSVTAPSATPGLFQVSGTHLYATAGTYAVSTTVLDASGDSATIPSRALVAMNAAVAPGLTGMLAVATANGPHAARGFTNTDRPTFSGTAPPYSIVRLYARHFNVDAQIPLGEAVADGDGRWTLTSGPLAVGVYTVSATATPPGGETSDLTPLKDSNGKQLVYIDLTPRLVRWLSHGGQSDPRHHKMPGSGGMVRHGA